MNKKITQLATVLLITVLSFSVGYIWNYNESVKNYQAACVLNEICKFALDDSDCCEGFDEIYYGTLENLDCRKQTLQITGKEIHENYIFK